MKRSERETTERAAEGKNAPLSKDTPGAVQQNGEVEPSREAAKKTSGTDEASVGR